MKSPQSNRSHPWKKVASRLSSPKNGEHYGAKDVGTPGDVRGSAVAKQKKDGIGVEAEVEVDYKRNPTPLFSRISHRLLAGSAFARIVLSLFVENLYVG